MEISAVLGLQIERGLSGFEHRNLLTPVHGAAVRFQPRDECYCLVIRIEHGRFYEVRHFNTSKIARFNSAGDGRISCSSSRDAGIIVLRAPILRTGRAK